MKAGEAEKWMAQELTALYDAGEAGTMASMALAHICGTPQATLHTLRERELLPAQEEEVKALLARLLRGEPLQYALKEAHFYGLDLYVNGAVLIPRPETEELVHWISSDVKAGGKDVFERGPSQADLTTQLKILDVGTGSGCIALALKKRMPKAEVWGCDISEEALNIARRNGAALDIRVDFQGMDFLDEAQQRLLPTVDIVVSNPPYIPLSEKDSMHVNVINYEPHTALFVPDNDPLLFYRALARFGNHRLYPGGSIYMEIHERLGTAVSELFAREGYGVELRKDMQGKDRMVKAAKAAIDG